MLALALAVIAGGCNGAVDSDDLPEWTLDPDLRIGEVDGPSALARIVGLEVGRNDEILVVEWNAGSVRVFGADGRFVRRIGRSGDGPGEFTYNPGRLWPIGDSLVAVDPLANRYHVFDADGALRETRVVRNVPVIVGASGFSPAVPLDDGTVVGSFGASMARARDGPPPLTPVVRYDPGARTLDTLAGLSYGNTYLSVMLDGGGFATTQPLQDGPLWEPLRDRSGIVLVDRRAAAQAADAAFAVTHIDLAGDTAFTRAFPYAPIRLDDAMADSIVDALAQRYGHEERFPAAALRKALREAAYLPAHLPPVTALVLGRDGTIWLRREVVADSVDWLVLDSQARPIARVATPAGLTIRRADREHVWAVVKDELDVEYVVRFTVRD